ncbi:hypothetical protein CUMW_157260, partial [Citrus unshiu]
LSKATPNQFHVDWQEREREKVKNRKQEKQKPGTGTRSEQNNGKHLKQLQGSNSLVKIPRNYAFIDVVLHGYRNYNEQVEGREWSFCFEKMDVNARSSHSNEKKSIDYSASANERNMSMEKNADTSVFVNHAELAWHENRRKWVGDQSQRPQRMDKDPIISWSTTYEELLLSNRPFPEPIPLPKKTLLYPAQFQLSETFLEEIKILTMS